MYSLGYLFDVQICVAVLYLVYVTLLHRHISYNSARIYLLLLLPVGLVIPLLNLSLLPVAEIALSVVVEGVSGIPSEITPIEEFRSINVYNLIYFIGSGLMLLWLMVGFVRLLVLFRKSSVERIEGFRVAFVKQESYAYTVLNSIFINERFRNSPILSELIAHEAEHIKFRHTYDLLYMSVMRALFWFNPIVWHMQYLLRQVHEYQVDRSVIEKGYSLKDYVNLLIMSEVGISPEFTTPFGYSFTKKRIAMLIKKNPTNRRVRLLVIIPVLASLLFAFSVTSRAAVEFPVVSSDRDTTFSLKGKNPIQVVESFQGSKDPIFLIDKVVVSKKVVDTLDMRQVQSVTILKDEAAVKIYGDDAKNGVVVIEMKKDIGVSNVEVSGGDASDVVVTGWNTKKKGQSNAAMISKVDLTNQERLVIVDGFESTKENYLKLSVDEIKSLTTLDKETGRAIYGVKGGKGVLIIETNRPKL